MSIRQSRKGVSAFTIQKLTRPIRVLTVTNLINAVKLMLNWTFTAPVYIVLISILLFVVVLYIRYCLQPVVDFLEVPMSIIMLQNSLGVQCSIVIYVNRSCLWSMTFIMGLAGVLTDQFLGAIKCIKEWLANTVVILKAWLSVKGLKVVKNVSEVSCSQASKLKLIIRASINLLRGSSTSSPLYSKINWLIWLLSLFLDLLCSSWVCLID